MEEPYKIMQRHKEPGRCDCGGLAIFKHEGREWCNPACLNSYLEFTGSTMRFDWAHGDAQRRFAPMKDPSKAPLSGFRYVDQDTFELRDSTVPAEPTPAGPCFHVKIKGTVTKIISIPQSEVASEEAAIELAHEIFSTEPSSDGQEHYNQETIDVKIDEPS